MFWRLALATCWRLTPVSKNACLAKNVSVFKSFQFFPRTFYDYSLSLSTETHPNTPCHFIQTPLLHLFTSKSSRKKVSCFEIHFREYLCWYFDFLLWVCFDILGIVLVWIIQVLFLCKLVSVDRFMYFFWVGFLKMICCLICDSCIIICWFPLLILFEPNTCGSFVLSDFSFVVNLV